MQARPYQKKEALMLDEHHDQESKMHDVKKCLSEVGNDWLAATSSMTHSTSERGGREEREIIDPGEEGNDW